MERRARLPGRGAAGRMVLPGAVLWLPGAFLLFGKLRGHALALDAMLVRDMLMFAILGLPLALMCHKIHALGQGWLAWGVFGVCAPVTVLLVLMGGLFGPLGLMGAALLGCLPALIAWSGLVLRARWWRPRMTRADTPPR